MSDKHGTPSDPRETNVGERQQTDLAPIEPPTPRPCHADMRIKRTIGGQEIVFAGFIREDDKDDYVRGDTMLERVSQVGLVPLDNSNHLEAHRKEWASDPELAPYYVVTNERLPEDPRLVRDFLRGHRGRGWGDLGGRFGREVLVACRAQ